MRINWKGVIPIALGVILVLIPRRRASSRRPGSSSRSS